MSKRKGTTPVTCFHCGHEYTTVPSDVREKNFCSREHYAAHMASLKEPNVTCAYCNVGFYKSVYKQKLSKSGLFFCSKEHMALASKKNDGKQILKTGPDKVLPEIAKKSFECKNCGKHQNETTYQKTFCNSECKSAYIANLKEKLCSFCQSIKSISYFDKKYNTHDGFSSRCKECLSHFWKNWYQNNLDTNRDINNFINREWTKTKPGKEYLLNKRLKKYNLTKEAFIRLIDECDGICQICNAKPFEAIDHCHETGRVRGLLCHQCNLSLGGFKDSVKELQKAINYLLQA